VIAAVVAGVVPAVVAACLLAGCSGPTPGGDHPLAGPPRSAARPADWPFWPRSVRIHPLTRLVEETDGTNHIEARIEFLDRQGDGTKASGSVDLALFDERRGPEDRRAIDYWASDLVGDAADAENFDPVTRTYLFKLQVVPEVFDLRPVLYVRHDSDDGRTMLDRMELRTDR